MTKKYFYKFNTILTAQNGNRNATGEQVRMMKWLDSLQVNLMKSDLSTYRGKS